MKLMILGPTSETKETLQTHFFRLEPNTYHALFYVEPNTHHEGRKRAGRTLSTCTKRGRVPQKRCAVAYASSYALRIRKPPKIRPCMLRFCGWQVNVLLRRVLSMSTAPPSVSPACMAPHIAQSERRAFEHKQTLNSPLSFALLESITCVAVQARKCWKRHGWAWRSVQRSPVGCTA
jgi:hypothetical protein